MSKKAYESILGGLEDALAYAKGNKSRGKLRKVRVPAADVRAIREKLGLTQLEFAMAFGVSPGTVQNWEQGRRQPEGPARVLLRVIERNPKAVLGAVGF
jgi:putative transcriptional regulator